MMQELRCLHVSLWLHAIAELSSEELFSSSVNPQANPDQRWPGSSKENSWKQEMMVLKYCLIKE